MQVETKMIKFMVSFSSGSLVLLEKQHDLSRKWSGRSLRLWCVHLFHSFSVMFFHFRSEDHLLQQPWSLQSRILLSPLSGKLLFLIFYLYTMQLEETAPLYIEVIFHDQSNMMHFLPSRHPCTQTRCLHQMTWSDRRSRVYRKLWECHSLV